MAKYKIAHRLRLDNTMKIFDWFRPTVVCKNGVYTVRKWSLGWIGFGYLFYYPSINEYVWYTSQGFPDKSHGFTSAEEAERHYHLYDNADTESKEVRVKVIK